MLRSYERLYSPDHQPIKSEPKDRTPPHHNISSPPLHAFGPPYEQNWGLENMQTGMGGPGPSHVNPAVTGHSNPFVQDIWQNQPYGQVSASHMQPPTITQNLQVLQPNMGQAMSPNMQPMSPNMQPLSPNMQQKYAAERMSPNMNVLSPHAQSMSPNMNVLQPHTQSMTPNMNAMSPHAQSMSPNMNVLSPNMNVLSPGMHGAPAVGRVSPNMHQNMGHVSPNMPQNMGPMSPNLAQHQQPTYAQQQQSQQTLMEQETNSAASLTNLLLDRADGSLLLNSSELSGLSALLGERPQDPQPLDY